VKILIVDDHALFRAGLRLLLATIGQNVMCLEAEDIGVALTTVAANPDIELCLLDLTLKNDHGLAAIQRIKDAAPEMAVVVVSGAEDIATIRACIDAGAMSFIPKTVSPEVLTHALGHVLKGAVYLPDEVASAMESARPNPALTPRQLQVLQCLSRGLPTKLISRELSLSEHTVKEHIALLFQALGARNRTEAVIKASRLRLQDLPAILPG